MTLLPVLAVTGLAAESRIAGGSGVVTLAGGGDPARLALLLQGALSRGARAVVSFGIAGGLAPQVRPGDVLLARSVDTGDARLDAEPALLERLLAALPHARVADLAGVDRVVVGTAGKRALHHATGAAAVDMESHIAARLAAQHGVPFAAVRVVADPAERTLPHAATVGMRPDGSTDAGAVLRSLWRHPRDLPALVHTALDARTAFASLRRCRSLLGASLGFADVTDGASDLLPAGGRPPVGLGTFAGSGEVQIENF